MNDLADLIQSTRSHHGVGGSVADSHRRLDLHELAVACAEAEDAIRAATRRPSPLVAVLLPLSVDAVIFLRAAIQGDFAVCLLDPSVSQERRAAVLKGIAPDVLVDQAGVHAFSSAEPVTADCDPGYVAMSSGSMGGPPKGVLSSWSSVAEFVPHGSAALDMHEHVVWAEVSHLSYDMAMTNILLAIGSGADLRLSGGLADRLRPLRFAERVKATHMRVAPRFVELAVAEKRRAPTSLKVWGSGGDRLHADHVGLLFDMGLEVIVNTYGTSETIGFASAARFEPQGTLADEHGTVSIGGGQVGPWHTLLVDPDQNSASRSGPSTLIRSMLGIQAPHLPRGYLFGNADGQFPRWIAADTVLTGDAGLIRDGQLYCLGRTGRRIKRRGSFIDLDEIDTAVRARTGFVSFTVSTTEGELVSLIESTNPQKAMAVRQNLRGVLNAELVPERVIATPALPRLGNGKVDQAEAQKEAEDQSGR
jgi:acyl-CoA synthetase (AMP-forming)/AMP-acid ligase II